jgi:putative ABC transport system substrate-binding protein
MSAFDPQRKSDRLDLCPKIANARVDGIGAGLAMKRREFITLVGGAAALWTATLRAQESAKMLRVGAVSGQLRNSPFWQPFVLRMTELGYEEGKNFVFDLITVSNFGGYEPGYRELAARNVDIIIASGPEISLKSALASSTTKPIVMVAIDYDPLARGYVTSLARPTGNVTGVFLQQIELTEKRVQLLKSAFPDLKAATVFWDRITRDQWDAAQRAGTNLGLRLSGVEFIDPPFDYDKALAHAAPDSRGTVFVLVSPFFFRDRAQQADFALRNRIVTMFGFREWTDAGGLMSYGASVSSMQRLAAGYVDRVARGVKPADLPIEQPTKFELVINLKTANALGINISRDFLLLADEVIE